MDEGCDEVVRRATFALMELITWLGEDLAGLRSRIRTGVVDAVPAERWHEVADGGGSSIAHLLLHLARHHDLALNAAIRGNAPVFANHREALGLGGAGASAGLGEREDPAVTAAASPEAIARFLVDVFDSTERWLRDDGRRLDLDVVPPTADRLGELAGLGRDEAGWLFDMWRDRPAWWVLQWPVLGHGHAHVGEAMSVRNRMGLGRF